MDSQIANSLAKKQLFYYQSSANGDKTNREPVEQLDKNIKAITPVT
jgi:hypothetical protein